MCFTKISLCTLFLVIFYALANSTTEKLTESPSQETHYFDSTRTAPAVKNVSCFLPVLRNWQKLICRELNFKFSMALVKKEICKPLTIPSKTIDVKGDGNCFFSVLSLWITGSVEYKYVLRIRLVNFMRTSERISSMFHANQRYDEYLDIMVNDGEYANFYELYGAAEMLNTSIYVYSRNEWQFISKDGIDGQEVVDVCVYLLHINDNHFQAVVDVQSVDT